MRKLACAALSFAGAAAAAHYLLPGGALLWCAGGLALLCLPAALLLRETARLRSLIICIFAALGLCWYSAYTAIYVEPAAGLAGSGSLESSTVCMTFIAVIMPSPVVACLEKMMWPDCSPPMR